MERKILHIDMDSFYASVESRRRGLEGQPVVVCVYSGRTEDSGAVSTCSYEARDLGIHAAMPIVQAKRIAEDTQQKVHFVPMDKEYYRQVSDKIRDQVLENHSDQIEQASIDEAYLDITDQAESFEKAEKIGENIQEEIREEFDLTCSIGIGPNKLVAKIASDREKPDGLVTVRPEEVKEFMQGLELSDIHGIGGKTVERLEEMGIGTVEELAGTKVARLVEEFGETQGVKLSRKARGEDRSEVEEDIQKQVTRITTLDQNSRSFNHVKQYLGDLAEEVIEKLEEEDFYFRKVGLIVIGSDITTYTRSRTLKTRVRDRGILVEEATGLLEDFLKEADVEVRRIGVRAGDLKVVDSQQSLDRF